MEPLATFENFEETAYLEANPDVRQAVERGELATGRDHFTEHGHKEGRRLLHGGDLILEAKRRKHRRVANLLRDDRPFRDDGSTFDFLGEASRLEEKKTEPAHVSSNEYDEHIRALIGEHPGGIILDCGAGRRPVYYDNVVNLEIERLATTDVVGSAEDLPFLDGVFDGVISIAVLEHLKDPFAAAREIVRVLKPGGRLLCCVPFLQPLHGYPNHYYNMTHEGLRELFASSLAIDDVRVLHSMLPIWTLTWFLRSWSDGLEGATRERFLDLRIRDLMSEPTSYLAEPFVTELSDTKNTELASATMLFAHKPET